MVNNKLKVGLGLLTVLATPIAVNVVAGSEVHAAEQKTAVVEKSATAEKTATDSKQNVAEKPATAEESAIENKQDATEKPAVAEKSSVTEKSEVAGKLAEGKAESDEKVDVANKVVTDIEKKADEKKQDIAYREVPAKKDKTEEKKVGWTQTGNVWYYFNAKGQQVKNAWVGSYWLGSDGKMVTDSWVDGGKYYVGSQGWWVKDAVKKTGWTQTGNTWYLYDNQGNLVKNAWSGNYWLGSDGKMVTNSWVDDGKYYVGSDGKQVKDAKRATDDKKPTEDKKPAEDKKSDTKKTGWVQTGSVWYHYNNQGELTKNAWVGSYWVGSDGKMVTNSWVDGGKYYVGNEGWYIPNYKLSVPALNMPQYYQSDARWGRKVYGIANMTRTGCVPTSLAMAFSGLGKPVTPVNVADVIYYNTKEFNVRMIGTSGAGADYAIKYYNFKNTVIKSKEQLVQALHTGNPVFALVGNGDFVKGYAYTHGIMLSGYQNGKTKAMDPASAYNTNKWYNVDRIWDQRSTDPYDTMLGGSFMLIEKKQIKITSLESSKLNSYQKLIQKSGFW